MVDVMEQVKDFLVRNKTEFAILKISHIRSDRGKDGDIKNQLQEFLNHYEEHFYCSTDEKVLLHELPIGQLRGKMLMVFDYNEHIDPSRGRFRYHDAGDISNATQPNIGVFDKYANKGSYKDMRSDQLEKWTKQSSHLGKGGLFLLSWTLTGDIVETLAAEANKHLLEELRTNVPRLGKPNIIYIDFLDKALTSSIIGFNFQ